MDSELQKDDSSNENTNTKKTVNIKKYIFIIVILLIIASPFIYNFVKYNKYKNEFKTTIINLTVRKYDLCSKIEIDGENCTQINVFMKDEFNDLNYNEKSSIISAISRDIRAEHELYLNKINTKYSYCNIFIYSTNDYYQYYESTSAIKKNGNEYNQSVDLKEKISRKIDDSTYEKYLDQITSISYLESILATTTTDDCKKEILYSLALNDYNLKNYDKSLEMFKNIDSSYKDVSDYIFILSIYKDLQGTWQGSATLYSTSNSSSWNVHHKLIISDFNCYLFESYNDTYGKYYLIAKDNNLYISSKDSFSENSIIYKVDYNDNTLTYPVIAYLNAFSGTITLTKTSRNTDLPKAPVNPYIGMTKSQAEESTWGKPNKINKTTTAYGTSEQWVYGNGKYLYFDNGKLISIQE